MEEPSYVQRVEKVIDDAIELFHDEITRELHSRQAGAVKKLCRECRKEGIPMKHLHKVAQLTDMLTKSLHQGVEEFLGPLCSLIELHGFPFVREKSFQALEYTRHQLAAISSITRAMECKYPVVHKEVARAISRFALQAHKGYSRNAQEKDLPFQIIAEGQVIGRLIQQLYKSLRTNTTSDPARARMNTSVKKESFDSDRSKTTTPAVSARTEPDDDGEAVVERAAEEGKDRARFAAEAAAFSKGYLPVTIAILEALRDVSFHEGCASLIVRADGLPMLSVFLYHDNRSPIVQLAVETLWNVLDVCPQAAYSFGTQDSNFQAISNLLERLENCYRLVDKELRGELAVILCLLAREPANHMPLVLNRCLDIALAQSTNYELLTKQLQGRSLSESDFEFKNTLWAFVLELLRCDLALGVIIDHGMTQALLVHIDPQEEEHPFLKLLNTQQKVELKTRAVQFLMQLLPRAPGLYTNRCMHEKLMAFTLKQLEKAESGLQHTEVTQRLNSLVLRALVKVCSKVETRAVHLHVNDVRLLFPLFNDAENKSMDRANAIRLLGLLCDHHPSNQRLFRREGGLRAMSTALEGVTAQKGKEVEVMYAIIDCIWRAVVGNPRNEAHWLRLNGVDLLLDAICYCAPEVRAMALGCLADMLLNPKALSYFWDWKGNVEGIEEIDLTLKALLPGHREMLDNDAEGKKEQKKRAKKRDGGSRAVSLLLKIWEIHRPDTMISDVLEEIYQATKSRNEDFDEEMAGVVFNTVQADQETGDYHYQTHRNGQIKVLPKVRALAFKEAFDKLDSDGSGSLDIEELIPLARGLGIKNMDPTVVHDLVRKIDIDGDGTISFIEVLAFLLVQDYHARSVEVPRGYPRVSESVKTTGRSSTAHSSARETKTARAPRTSRSTRSRGAQRGGHTGPSTRPMYARGSIPPTREEMREAEKRQKRIFNENVRHMVFAVVSLIGNTHPDLTRDQRSQLNIISRYEKLIQGLDWCATQSDIVEELAMEGLEPIDTDIKWIQTQVEGFEDTVMNLKMFSYDKDAADTQMQSNLLDEFVGSVKLKIEEKGRALTEELAARPASVKQRKAAKDMKEEIIKSSLDMRATLKRTLHCKDEDLQDLLAQTKAAKERMRQRALKREGSMDTDMREGDSKTKS
uniref:EF-hand domain-containing protein n=1 Tax=Lotharella globosa TaxID=91324 RepID=A0A7S3Z8C0_9EUKA|mmetsp:Transcript_21761/g.43680  ORF Transcript_21761/g.43680 Transcript_21761/m.43680 type:complete len:1146 (+) Transcript_21761:46-3483(+)